MRILAVGPILLSLFIASPALAQNRRNVDNDPDMKELAAYTLTMDALNRIARVNRAVLAEMQNDPRYAERAKLSAELAQLEKKDDPSDAEQKRIDEIHTRIEQLEKANDDNDLSDAQTLSDMEKKINSIPGVAAALKKEGMSAREYAKFTLALFQAELTVGIQKMPGAKKDVPEGVNPANLKFVQEHEAELKALQASYAPLSK